MHRQLEELYADQYEASEKKLYLDQEINDLMSEVQQLNIEKRNLGIMQKISRMTINVNNSKGYFDSDNKYLGMIGVHSSRALQIDKRLIEIEKLIKQNNAEKQAAENDYLIKIETFNTFKKYFDSITMNDAEWSNWQIKVKKAIKNARIPNSLVDTAVVRFKKSGLIQIFIGDASRRYGKNSECRIISKNGQLFHLYENGVIQPL